jgi:hypothetical protein
LAVLADLLTLSRLVAAGILVWLGIAALAPGTDNLLGAIAVCVAAWSTDQLDGWAARRADRPTRLAGIDFPIDSTLYLAILAYLTMAGYLTWLAAAIYVVLATLSSLIVRRKAFQLVWLRLIDVTCLVVVFTYRPRVAWFLLAWLVVLGLLYRNRLAERVPRWLSELGRIVDFRGRS